MGLEKLEKYKTQYSYFNDKIGSLQSYLKPKISNPIEIINPNKVSEALAIPQIDAIFLLSLAEKEHLLKKVFFVYSYNNDFLGEFDNMSVIPRRILNDNTGKFVDENNFYIDVAFVPEK